MMTRLLSSPARVLPLAATVLLFCLAPVFGLAPALAQGTPEQRKACAPDAIRLCQETIPDENRTAACMRSHLTALSPACRTAFLGATGGKVAVAAPHARRTAKAVRIAKTRTARGPARRHYARTMPASNDDIPGPRFVLPDYRETRSDARRAGVVVHRLCRNNILDADTCAFTNQMINLAR